MSSAPRAARRGGKVADNSPATAQPEMSPLDLPSPVASAQTSSILADDAGLLSSFLQSADVSSTAPPLAVGVVRGRGLTTSLKEISATADRADVESRVKAAIDGITSAAAASNLTSLDAEFNPMRHISFNDVTLASDYDRIGIPCKIVQNNGKHRVLVVSPTVAVGDAELCAKVLSAKVGDAVGIWDGSHQLSGTKCRMIFTNFQSFMSYLKKVRETPGFGVFTHIVFSNCVHAARSLPDFDVILCVLRDELRNTQREHSPRVVICGAARDDFGSFFEPLKCAELVSQHNARRGAVNVYTADETAALCSVSMKTTSGSNIPRGPTTSAEAIHPRVIEHANDTARLVIDLLLEHFDASKPMRAIVFSADAADFEKLLLRHNVNQKADVVLSLGRLQDATEVAQHTIAVISNSIPDSVASAVRANVIIDLGMEKRLVAAPPAEATLPVKATVRATSREVGCRLHALGWGSSGIAFHVLAGPAATSACEEDQQAYVTSSILRTIRAGLPVANVRECIFRATQAHHAAVETGLAVLSEQCAVNTTDRLGLTFLGDLLARLPLSTDAGLMVTHGLVFGFPELAAAVATALTVDVRGHCPPSFDVPTWIQRCDAYAKSKGVSHFSDVLVGAMIIIGSAKGRPSEAICIETGANPISLRRAVDTFNTTMRELRDYAFIAPAAESALIAQLEKYQNHLVYIISACFARNAAIVRSESDEVRNAPERGSLMMQRTTKDVVRSHFSPSSVKWTASQVVVPAHINNTHSKFIASNITTLSHAFFHSSLLLLHPALAFELISEESVLFAVTINRVPKRLTVDVDTSARVLDFREKWCTLFGVSMLKRSLPRDATPVQLASLIATNQRRLDVSSLRDQLCATFLQLVQDIESKEAQIAPPLGRLNLLAAAQLVDTPVAAGSDDEALARVFEGKPFSTDAASTTTPEPEPARVEDDVEVEGTVFAPIIEED